MDEGLQSLFRYVREFTPRVVELPSPKFRPMIPDYVAAVHDPESFVQLPRPDKRSSFLGLRYIAEPSLTEVSGKLEFGKTLSDNFALRLAIANDKARRAHQERIDSGMSEADMEQSFLDALLSGEDPRRASATVSRQRAKSKATREALGIPPAMAAEQGRPATGSSDEPAGQSTLEIEAPAAETPAADTTNKEGSLRRSVDALSSEELTTEVLKSRAKLSELEAREKTVLSDAEASRSQLTTLQSSEDQLQKSVVFLEVQRMTHDGEAQRAAEHMAALDAESRRLRSEQKESLEELRFAKNAAEAEVKRLHSVIADMRQRHEEDINIWKQTVEKEIEQRLIAQMEKRAAESQMQHQQQQRHQAPLASLLSSTLEEDSRLAAAGGGVGAGGGEESVDTLSPNRDASVQAVGKGEASIQVDRDAADQAASRGPRLLDSSMDSGSFLDFYLRRPENIYGVSNGVPFLGMPIEDRRHGVMPPHTPMHIYDPRYDFSPAGHQHHSPASQSMYPAELSGFPAPYVAYPHPPAEIGVGNSPEDAFRRSRDRQPVGLSTPRLPTASKRPSPPSAPQTERGKRGTRRMATQRHNAVPAGKAQPGQIGYLSTGVLPSLPQRSAAPPMVLSRRASDEKRPVWKPPSSYPREIGFEKSPPRSADDLYAGIDASESSPPAPTTAPLDTSAGLPLAQAHGAQTHRPGERPSPPPSFVHLPRLPQRQIRQ